MAHVISKPVVSTKPEGFWIHGNCYYNAQYNKNNAFKDVKGLRVVYGSLGLAGHFEYGGKTWGAKEFYPSPFDSHAWLEDEQGNVYDYIYEQYRNCARMWGKKPSFPVNWEVFGETKQDLAEMGLEYVPAPKGAQKDILRNVIAMYQKKFRCGSSLEPISFDPIV